MREESAAGVAELHVAMSADVLCIQTAHVYTCLCKHRRAARGGAGLSQASAEERAGGH